MVLILGTTWLWIRLFGASSLPLYAPSQVLETKQHACDDDEAAHVHRVALD